jgi:SAM-dependent methyltransferase
VGERLAIWRDSPAFESAHAARLDGIWTPMILSRRPGFGRRPIKARFGRPLPLRDAAYEAVYLLHVFEHARQDELVPMLRELHRVLKPGAAIRLSTPDAEAEARLYLATLDRARRDPTAANEAAYLLAVTRMIDQCVRARVGGEMAKVAHARQWRDQDLEATYGKALDFVIGRGERPASHGWRRKDIRDLPFALWRRLLHVAARGHPAGTGEYDLLKPDEFVFREALSAAGFTDVAVCQADASRIPDWERWDFDRAADGTLIEPGLYIEATRP